MLIVFIFKYVWNRNLYSVILNNLNLVMFEFKILICVPYNPSSKKNNNLLKQIFKTQHKKRNAFKSIIFIKYLPY